MKDGMESKFLVAAKKLKATNERLRKMRSHLAAANNEINELQTASAGHAALLKEDTLSQRSTKDLLEELSYREGPEVELARAGLLALRKAVDYNAGLSRDRYFPLGLASYAQMIHVKSERLLSFARNPREALNEPVIDTLHDVINYASFAADWMRRTT